MTAQSSRAGAFREGALTALPLQFGTFPFGVIFGALARDAGLSLEQAMTMTGIVTAGAAQIAALSLAQDAAPALLAILAGAVVNLRMLMYSASLAPHLRGASLRARAAAALVLHDQTYAMTYARAVAKPEEPDSARLAFYFGVAAASFAAWVSGSLVGATLGGSIPPAWGVGFAIPAVFIAVVAPFLTNPAHLAAAASATAGALLLNGLPLSLGLACGAVIGVAAGVATETLMEARR